MLLILVLLCANNEYDITVEKIHDADTITATIHLGFDTDLVHQTIRLKDFDAYEVNKTRRTVKVTDEEIVLGKQATAILKEMIFQAKRVYVTEGKRGAYGRLELRLYINDEWSTQQEVAIVLKAMGYDRDSRGKILTLEEFRKKVDDIGN
jgi:endonuclease YncB( thermonuclease family)